MSTLTELQKEALKTNREHGFGGADVPTCIALIHSELSEALESYRKGEPLLWFDQDERDGCRPAKPEGLIAEYADACIRMMSHCEELGYDLQSAIEQKMAYNKTRPYKHGGRIV